MIGTLIYAKDSYNIYEVDGEEHQVLSSFSLVHDTRSKKTKKREKR